jgi:hypothetical protein
VKSIIVFDFPEANDPIFAAFQGDAPAFSTNLANAKRFDSEEIAQRFLTNAYGPSSRRFGVVAEVEA